MKATRKIIGRLIVGCVFTCCLSQNIYSQTPPGGGGGTNGTPYTPPPDIPNYSKFVGQYFSVIHTNIAGANDTNLYNALLSFAANSSTNPVIQILPYQGNCLLIKASHFDYSGETARDFTLAISDKAETPLYKSVNLSTVTTNNGWLVQGSVSYRQVTDPMYLIVSNISRIYNVGLL